MVSAKIFAPPILSSSRFTLVTTACFKPSVATASATRDGSCQSMACGRPLGTAQNPQRRVQMSPSSMNVAVRWFQHSPILGHCADSQTVCKARPRASFFKLWKFSPTGALARNHSGFGWRTGGPVSICTSWSGLAMGKSNFTWQERDHGNSWNGTLTKLVFGVAFDPALQAGTAFVLHVKAHPKAFRLFPVDGAAHPDARQGEQRKRDFYLRARCDFLSALQGHTSRADFAAGGVESMPIGQSDRNLGHYRNPHIAAKLVQHEHMRGADQFKGAGALYGLLEHCIDAGLRKLHRFLGATAQAVDHHAVVRG